MRAFNLPRTSPKHHNVEGFKFKWCDFSSRRMFMNGKPKDTDPTDERV
ncbi:uncharacterized protein G2W53_007020 [Senna tora]|uniref:Uncharacterized protein n=1 Tax=Senna tora TaxID=362788 RepID=A0A834X4M3_9FABA|nr:uncharacterized protein G2W53_007020 [Senna tora]